jgi:Fur family ferric uptake transcriptional regulator
MANNLQQFESRLRDSGLKVTAGRRAIVGHALRHFGHFEAEELFASLRRAGSSVSRATLYRTLGRLVEAGLVRKHPLEDGRTFYEPAFDREHHEHLVCVRCGEILEFVQDEIERLQDEVCREHRFQPLSHTLQIYGTCERCQRETPKRKAAGASR